MAIATVDDFEKLFNKINEEVINAVSLRAVKLLKKHIMDDMYGALPNKRYEDGTGMPTFQFREAFVFKEMVKLMNGVSKTLFYDYESMDRPSSAHPTRHGRYKTKDESGSDNRQALAEMLNKREIVGSKMRNLYWDNFIRELDSNIGNWFYTEYNNRGVKLNKNTLNLNWDLDL